MIFRILSLLLTPYGMLAFAVGLLLFIMLPMIPRTLGIFHGFANVHLKLGARMLKRAAVVISEQGDLLLKRMRPNDVGTEEVEFKDDTKEFEDAHQAKSNWMGIPFAFGDEAHGVLFSLRDAAIGRREIEAQKNDEVVVKATEREKAMYDVHGWQKAVYEFSEGVYELVNLNHIRHLMTGNERGEHPQRVKTYYRNSRVPYQDGPSTARVLLLIVALLAPFGAVFVIWQQMGSGGGGGSTVIGMVGMVGMGLLGGSDDEEDDPLKVEADDQDDVDGEAGDPLAPGSDAEAQRDDEDTAVPVAAGGGGEPPEDGDGGDDGNGWDIDDIDWETRKAQLAHLAKVSLVVLPLPAILLALTVFVNPVFALSLAVILGLGFLTVPVLVEILKISDGITHSLSHTLLKLGLSAYRDPVWVETPGSYELREYDDLDAVDEQNVAWHTLLGRKCGFTFEPSPEMWGTELADKTELKNQRIHTTEASAKRSGDNITRADGGESKNLSGAPTHTPNGYALLPDRRRAVYGGMVPSIIDDDSYFLWSGIALGRFKNVAIGRKTFKRLEKSKEEFGEDNGMSDKSLIIAMSVTGTLSLLAGIIVFFVLIGV